MLRWLAGQSRSHSMYKYIHTYVFQYESALHVYICHDTFFLPVQICSIFLFLKGRGKSVLGLLTISVLTKRMPPCSAKMCWPHTESVGIVFASFEVVHRSRSDSLLHFDSKNIFSLANLSGKINY